MASITTLIDDFIPLWGVDTSKWTASGSYSMLAPQGLQLSAPVGSVVPTAITSNLAYDVAVASPVYAKVYATQAINTNSEMQLIEMSGSQRRWAFKYDGSSDTIRFMRQQNSTSAWGEVGSTPAYNGSTMAWWRLFYSYDGKMYWQISNNGTTWNNSGSYVEPSPPVPSKLRFYHYNTSTATPGNGKMTIYFVNTTVPIPRGAGWLSENFDAVTNGDFTPGLQYADFVQVL